jgi:hypothetical protein
MSGWSHTKVECYSGYRADERPLAFTVDDRKLKILKLLETWREPDRHYFRVQASDDAVYLLEHHDRDDLWRVELSHRSR